MANVATLIAPLVLSGSRLSDGTANASGTLNAYLPATTTSTPIYADPAGTVVVAQPVTFDNAGRIPVATYANGVYSVSPVRLIVKDVSGNVVSDVTYLGASAGNVGVNNASFPGETTIDGALTALGASLGGTDGKYLEHSGATGRLLQDKFREISISVKDYGAAGDGLADDTAAIQAAVNRIVALGGGVVYFPPGTYKISSSAISVAASTGVVLRGAGRGATTISQTSSVDSIAVAASTDFVLSGMSISGSGGGGVVFTTAVRAKVIDVSISSAGTTGLKFTGPIAFGDPGACVSVLIGQSSIAGATNGLWLDNTLGATVRDCVLGGATNAAKYTTNTTGVYWSNVHCQATTSALFSSDVGTSSGFSFTDCDSIVGIIIDSTALSSDPGIVQRNCGMNSITKTTPADGTTQSHPDTNYATNVIRVSSGAGTAILGTPLMAAGAFQDGKEFVIEFWNNSGSDVVWSINAIWHVATTVSGTNANRTIIRFRYDNAATCWREMSRAVTT